MKKKEVIASNEALQFARRKSAQDTYLDKSGREVPDGIPMQPPLGYRRSPSLAEQIRKMVVSERLKQEAAAAGAESWEEADDFDVGDDYDPRSPYEEVFEGVPADPLPEELGRRIAAGLLGALREEDRPGGEPADSESPEVPSEPAQEAQGRRGRAQAAEPPASPPAPPPRPAGGLSSLLKR